LNIVDEFTREALATEVKRTIDADETVAVLERLTSIPEPRGRTPGSNR